MKTSPKTIVFGLILQIILLAGCGSDSNATNANSVVNNSQIGNANNANSTKDNLEDFKGTVKLPLEPVDVVWREDNGKLIAVLQFKTADTEKIVAQAAGIKAGTPAVVDTETWFPAEVIAQSQVSGDETVKGISYSANDFLQPPYTAGKLTRIESSDYFVLELTSN